MAWAEIWLPEWDRGDFRHAQALVVVKGGNGIKNLLPVLYGHRGQGVPLCWDHTARWVSQDPARIYKARSTSTLPPSALSVLTSPSPRGSPAHAAPPLLATAGLINIYLAGFYRDLLNWGRTYLSIGDVWAQVVVRSEGPSEHPYLGSACVCTRRGILHP